MATSSHCSRLWVAIALLGASSLRVVSSTGVTPILQPGFFFNWEPQLPFPVTVTEQCETINITWSRSSALGANPVAPYFLQVYTSNFIQPFVIPAGNALNFSWAIPFAPGTIYQICMYDKFGTTGGCQDQYTVIPSSSELTPSCTNVTFVHQLNVTATVDNGPMSQYGFVDQCTDISLTPQGGLPPYTLTVAPSLHPPYNITSFDMSPINWTVSLNWAMPFFISLADSNGSMWSNGPLHAGSGGTIGCLAGNVTSSHHVKVPVAIGVSFAGLIFGVLVGTIGTFVAYKRKNAGFVELPDTGPLSRMMVSGGSQRRVDPFQLGQGEEGSSQASGGQLYVLHHDSDTPPVTIYTQEGTEIVELPPRYPAARKGTPSDNVISARRSPDTQSSTDTSMSEQEQREERESRHYNPRGPLQLHQNRQPNFIRKNSMGDTV